MPALVALLLAFFAPALRAQENMPNDIAFIRIINAVAAGQGKATFFLDGADLFPKGYELGQLTGGIGVKAGKHEITIKKNGVITGKTSVNLKGGETLTMIGFSELIPPKEQGEKPQWQIRILRLKQKNVQSGYHITYLSVCDKDEIAIKAAVMGKEKTEAEYVKRLHTTDHNLGGKRGEVIIKVDDEILKVVSPDTPGNYVVVFYQDESGKVKALSFYDPKFVVAG